MSPPPTVCHALNQCGRCSPCLSVGLPVAEENDTTLAWLDAMEVLEVALAQQQAAALEQVSAWWSFWPPSSSSGVAESEVHCDEEFLALFDQFDVYDNEEGEEVVGTVERGTSKNAGTTGDEIVVGNGG
ncbi:hypothetical protein BV898_00226 [Hypsibius exemplaris]|uniref:Uncharacterized protein n=1 Tax=Hypsibius exemplaris TaxID=2072580 RepID=A0A1W0XF41_HYPEX|nr:hypothetical protein BV898_00226 [Hypsibius exemplaris]